MSAKYNSKVHYYELGASTVASINGTINSIIYSVGYLEGKFIMCDEIHPLRLAQYLIRKKGYISNQDTITYYVAHLLKRKINEFYKNLRNGFHIMSFSMGKDALREFEEKGRARLKNGVKLIK